jgi:hypothetical protein
MASGFCASLVTEKSDLSNLSVPMAAILLSVFTVYIRTSIPPHKDGAARTVRDHAVISIAALCMFGLTAAFKQAIDWFSCFSAQNPS